MSSGYGTVLVIMNTQYPGTSGQDWVLPGMGPPTVEKLGKWGREFMIATRRYGWVLIAKGAGNEGKGVQGITFFKTITSLKLLVVQ